MAKNWLCTVSFKRPVVVAASTYGEAVEKIKQHASARKVYVRVDQREEQVDEGYEAYADVFHMQELKPS